MIGEDQILKSRQTMTIEDRLRLAYEAAERGDHERCYELLRPIEAEIDRIRDKLVEFIVTKTRSSVQ
jgi:hypothetical protein